jgi:outer membrane protein assembly factor BamB
MNLVVLAITLLVSGLNAQEKIQWPSFRGAPSNPGVAPGSIQAKPKLVWKFKTESQVKGTPVIVNERVYIGSADEHMYCISLKDGKEIWKKKMPDMIESSPLFLKGHLIVGTSDGDLLKMKADNGETVWSFKAEDRFAGAATYIMKDGKPIIIAGNYDNFIYALNFETGKKIWGYETDNYVNGTPAIYKEKIVFGGCDSIMYILNTEGKLTGEVDMGSYIAGTVAVENGQAYIGHYDNKYFRVDLEKEKIVWFFKKSNFPYFSSAAIGKDRIIFGGRDKRVHAVTKDEGKPLWEFKTRGKVDSSPVLCDNKVVFGSYDGRMYILDAKTGKELWRYEIGKPIIAAPAIINGYILIGGSDGIIYAFK